MFREEMGIFLIGQFYREAVCLLKGSFDATG